VTIPTYTPAKDAPSTESYIHEWTEKIHMKVNVEKGLGLKTSLSSIDVVLEEVRGSRYVFAGSNEKLGPQLQYFFWNSVTESCGRTGITIPSGKNNIIKQIKNDITT
jgi:hypothetical protein